MFGDLIRKSVQVFQDKVRVNHLRGYLIAKRIGSGNYTKAVQLFTTRSSLNTDVFTPELPSVRHIALL